jgi:hypothetical protein
MAVGFAALAWPRQSGQSSHMQIVPLGASVGGHKGPAGYATPASVPARTAWASSPRRAILSPGNLAVTGATYDRVPPLHSGQTLDCELPGKISVCREDGRRSEL